MKYAALAFVVLCGCGSSRESSAGGEVRGGDAAVQRPIARTEDLKAIEALIAAGHPWRATQLIAPILRNAATRTPDALVLAAEAAAGWGGWAEVDKLLAREPWIDSQFDGEARELLARSALERGDDSSALTQTAAALRDAGAASRATRLVLYARALERNNFFDSAAVVYDGAGQSLRPIRDWLDLRAAGNLSDSAKRSAALSRVTLAVARPRVPWTEAQARERFSDALGAASRYAALGALPSAFRLRLSVAPDVPTRDAIRAEAITFIRTHSGSADAKATVDVLDRAFPALSPNEEIIIARSSAASGPPARAIVGFQRALAQAGLLTPNDHLLYGLALSRANRSRDAIAELSAVQGPLAGQAAYQKARVLLAAGSGEATRSALRAVVASFPSDSASASAALYLLGDLSTDDGDDAQARAFFKQLARTYPTSSRAPTARFGAAIIALVAGQPRTAALELDSLATSMPRSDEANAARYWSGRAWAAAGDSALARTRWTDLLAQQPATYYATVSAKRLGVPGWTPPGAADSFAHIAAVDSAVVRAALLERLGMDIEARFEYEALETSAPPDIERIAATAQQLLVHGQPSRTIRLAQKLIDLGRRDARTYRLLFPLLDRDELQRDAQARGLDPALVAGLIRQESNFNAHAVSVANARGLMQVLPSVGEEIARGMSYPVWYPALLTDADANLQLGTAHLATYMKQYGPLPRVLAAYNAGGSRVTRWAAKPGTDDPELFAERIPFVETRDYVRIVQRNAEFYRALYRW